MGEKNFFSKLFEGDERQRGLNELQKQLNDLYKVKSDKLLSIQKKGYELKDKLKKAEPEEKESIVLLIEDLKKEKEQIKEQYKIDKDNKKKEIESYKEETKRLAWEKEKQKLIEKGYSDSEIEEKEKQWNKSLLQKIDDSLSKEQSADRRRPFGSVKLQHLGGHPKLRKGKVTIRAGKERGTLQFGSKTVTVIGMEWMEKGKRSGGKAAAGALVGGLITAPVTWGAGAIVGAAIGGRRKDDSVVAVAFTEDNINYTMYLKAEANEYQKLCKLLA
ncbi:hypothetical protein MHB73_21060 [Bacillus sp. FSL K6-6483]